ncbi:MAG: TIR domain-containing protein [Candidatus Taylorbacteria bacterium]|nr:TIR domain-containing protein [Candidatus Taylorbacteria bacterium]
MKPKVFVSFDYDNDRNFKYLLEAWNKNPKFDFVFDDATPEEINSTNVGRIKAALTLKIKSATHTLVIVGKYANFPHQNRSLIGYKNWINFEIHQSIELGKRIAVVKLDRSNESPEELTNANVAWAYSFTEDNIIKALETAPFFSRNIQRYV